MSGQAEEKIRVSCPGCQKQLAVPSRAAGRKVACPACRHQFPISPAEVAAAPQVAVPPIATPAMNNGSPLAAAPPIPRVPSALPANQTFAPVVADSPAESTSPFDFAVQDQSPSARARRNAEADNSGGSFAMEKKGMQMGVVGGIIMMALAGLWFVGGLAAGYIFFYPPILFVFGLIAFFKGLADGNVAGGRRRRY